jgi:hypothetical protein
MRIDGIPSAAGVDLSVRRPATRLVDHAIATLFLVLHLRSKGLKFWR